MRILITGSNGQVGYELARSLAVTGHVFATDRRQLDLTNPSQIRECISTYKPDLIVNAAAYTAVDKAEQEPALARTLNTDMPSLLAELAVKQHFALIHYSTDYVFNGEGNRPWHETDKPDPLGIYGKTKLEGEQAIMASGCPYLIFRTSWVYGTRGHNFLRTMQQLAVEHSEVGVVADQIGAPTWCRHLADATAQVTTQSMGDESFWERCSGLYHLSAAGQTSWHGFAEAIFDDMAKSTEKVAELRAITSDDYSTPAKRPANSILDNTKFQQTFHLRLPDWAETLKLVLNHD